MSPVHLSHDHQGPYAQWGHHGHRYHYRARDRQSREAAKADAERQGQAAYARGYREGEGFRDWASAAIRGAWQGAKKIAGYAPAFVVGGPGAAVAQAAYSALPERTNAPPAFRKVMEDYGKDQVTELAVCRKPIVKAIETILNAVTFGHLERAKKENNYDKVYHLTINAKVRGRWVKMEKNEVLNAVIVDNLDGECRNIPLPGTPITLNALIENGAKFRGPDFYIYNPVSANCQDWVMSIIKGNHLQADESFIVQKAETLIPKWFQGTARNLTGLASKIDLLLHGTGFGQRHVQSVLFRRSAWDPEHARSWLAQHGLEHSDEEPHPTELRFRQQDPQNFHRYTEKKLIDRKGHDTGIRLVLGY